jgi:hypothetical protein
MLTNPNNATSDASYEHAQRTHDVMLVSTIALWAMLIGFVPVAALPPARCLRRDEGCRG